MTDTEAMDKIQEAYARLASKLSSLNPFTDSDLVGQAQREFNFAIGSILKLTGREG